MAFAISPDALDSHAAKLTELSDAIAGADAYATEHLTIGLVDTSFVFAGVIGDCDRVLASITTLQKDLTDVLVLSSAELAGTAQRSRDLDDALEGELDSAYPGEIDPLAARSIPTAQAAYVVPFAPGAVLTTPVDEGEVDLVGEILGADWFSPSFWLMQVMDLVLDWNPVDVVAKNFSGNWNALYTFESAAYNLGRFHVAQADNIGYAMSVTANTWKGEAADAANIYFTKMASVTRTTGNDLMRIAPEFSIVARSMETTGDNVGGLLNSAIDAMIVAAVIYAAGAATSATGVGAIVGALGGSAALVTAVVWLDQAWNAISGVMAIVEALSMTIEFFSTYDSTQSGYVKPIAYDNPTVDL